MHLTRVIPVLLLKDDGMVKTEQFRNPKYIGDPLNAVKIFNDKEVDELILCDITATSETRDPHYDWIKNIVGEAFMPVGYGGGIRSIEQASRLFEIGVEKVIINSCSFNESLISALASRYGSQSIVVSIDVRKTIFGGYSIYTESGTKKHKIEPAFMAITAVNAGAGEIIIQSIDREGTMKGFDLELTKVVSEAVDVPVVASGGGGDQSHLRDAVKLAGASAVAGGSMFVYKGKHRAVLINYPSQQELKALFT